jgi:uncharacterized membrane-anchored protein YjiN (DUF445 family)
MRFFATAPLVLMLMIFVATSYAQHDWPWLAYPRAFAEAGMIAPAPTGSRSSPCSGIP